MPPDHVSAGPTLFARYAYPPNERGLCGPADHQALLEYADALVVDGGLRQLARGFQGAWPYLELIASANGIDDPLDASVVEAYWLGDRLTPRVPARDLAGGMETRFPSMGRLGHDSIVKAAFAGLPPTHGFHVFCVYPWLGLLRDGREQPALEVIDSCRIRWGELVEIDGETAVVRSSRLVIVQAGTGQLRLELGPVTAEVVTIARDGASLAHDLRPGHHVSMHWGWLCDALKPRQLRALRQTTTADLRVANAILAGDAIESLA